MKCLCKNDSTHGGAFFGDECTFSSPTNARARNMNYRLATAIMFKKMVKNLSSLSFSHLFGGHCAKTHICWRATRGRIPSRAGGRWIRKGNLEHLHLFCHSIHLKKARSECNQKIESALYAIYDFAAMREFHLMLSKTTRRTTSQEQLLSAAKDAELMDRPIVRSSRLLYEKRSNNIAIRSRHEIQT
jgi:hypothetical protein